MRHIFEVWTHVGTKNRELEKDLAEADAHFEEKDLNK